MSLFPRFTTGEFGPLFRLLDEYDTHRSSPRTVSSVRTFQPLFDVREHEDSYELHGELPGIKQSDISIEFSDPQTIVISGRTERSFESDKPPARLVEGGSEKAKITEKGHEQNQAAKEKDKAAKDTPSDTPKYWISERSVGEFHRSFGFPTRIDHDGVTANLKDGILNITVPKKAPMPLKKIQVTGE